MSAGDCALVDGDPLATGMAGGISIACTLGFGCTNCTVVPW